MEAGKNHVVEYLITRGADVNKVTFAGNTPLHTASGRDMDQMVKLLIQHGANVNIANLEGDIPKVGQTSEQVGVPHFFLNPDLKSLSSISWAPRTSHTEQCLPPPPHPPSLELDVICP